MATKSDKKGLIIRVLGSTGLMLWILNKIEWSKIIEVAKAGSIVYFIAAAFAIQLTVATSIWKWKMLVDSSLNQDEKGDASVIKLGRFYYIGLFFNNFLPGSVGGDVVRVYYLGRITGIPIATASVAFERISSGAALVGIAIFSSLFMESARSFLLPILLGSAMVFLVFYLFGLWMKTGRLNKEITSVNSDTRINIWLMKLKSELFKIAEIALNYRKEGLKWWLSIATTSLLFQVGLAWINHLLFLSFDIHIPWLELLMIITLISVITMLPISVNGLGVREGCYVLFFKGQGVPTEIAITVSLLFFILVSLSSLAGGLFWMVERGRQK
ncbi:MAG: flippase-like domain-containing protein [Bacillus sp. (in: Bacteria)]|nr:flippase-like domain-containing protein [Bacillus sp. (in: firmicutes)]